MIRIRIDRDDAERLGKARQQIHRNNSTERFFDDPNTEDICGVMGEMAFSVYSGLPVDTNLYEHGDGKKDFEFTLGGRKLSIDVKAARKPYNLLVKEKDAKDCADILILAGISGDDVSLIGWEHKSLMVLSPVKEFGYGIRNHYRGRKRLREMEQLKDLIVKGDEL